MFLLWLIWECLDSRSRCHLRGTDCRPRVVCISSLKDDTLFVFSRRRERRFNLRLSPCFFPPPRFTAGSLVLLFEKELGFSNAQADTQFALWSGVCYVMPLFGGWIADRFLGECFVDLSLSHESTKHACMHAYVCMRRTLFAPQHEEHGGRAAEQQSSRESLHDRICGDVLGSCYAYLFVASSSDGQQQ